MVRPISYDPDTALDRALELFWCRGYHSVSIEDIVRATGLNRHSLYTRFGSKYGLLEATLHQYREAVLDRIDAILSEPAQTPRERLARLFGMRHDDVDPLWSSLRDRGCFALRMTAELRDSHGDLGDALDLFAGKLEELLARAVQEGQELGEIRRDRTPEHLAAVLAGGFLLPLIYNPGPSRAAAFLETLD